MKTKGGEVNNADLEKQALAKYYRQKEDKVDQREEGSGEKAEQQERIEKLEDEIAGLKTMMTEMVNYIKEEDATEKKKLLKKILVMAAAFLYSSVKPTVSSSASEAISSSSSSNPYVA